MMRPCLDCKQPIVWGTRCRSCKRMQQRVKNRLPHRQAYRDPEYLSVPLSGYCAACGVVEDLTRDHIVPLIKGGTNDASNIRLLCRECNSVKGART